MGLEDKTNFPIGVSATFQGLLLLNFKWVTRWWQLKDFWNFHEFSPQKIGGKKKQFDDLRIFFNWVPLDPKSHGGFMP